MFKCLLCNNEFINQHSLSAHISKFHKINIRNYKIKFNLIRKCEKCQTELSKRCRGNLCNKCRDRSGEKNTFYGKKHTIKTINKIKEKTSINSTLLWKNEDYRNKVIFGVSKPRKESFKSEQSIRIKKWYKENPIQREIRRKNMKESWEEGKICNDSKEQLEFFKEVKKLYSEAQRNIIIRISDQQCLYPDILLPNKGIIIEYFGDYWHANPKIYKKDDIICGLKASEIWERNKKRIESFQDISLKNKKFSYGYKVIVVWEKDYRTNKEQVLKDISSLIEGDGGCSI